MYIIIMIKGGVNMDKKSIYIDYETREIVVQIKTRVYNEDGHITSDAKVEQSISIDDIVSFGSEALRFILSQDIGPLMEPAAGFVEKMTESIENVVELTKDASSGEEKRKLEVSVWNRFFAKWLRGLIKDVERWFHSFSWVRPE